MAESEEDYLINFASWSTNTQQKIRIIQTAEDSQLEKIASLVAKASKKFFDDALYNTYHRYIKLLEGAGDYGRLSKYRSRMKRKVLQDQYFIAKYSVYLMRQLMSYGGWR